jgi:hypothetical protein
MFNHTPEKNAAVIAPWHRGEEVRQWGPKRAGGRMNKSCVDRFTGDVRAVNVGSPDFPKMMVNTSPYKVKSTGYARMLKGRPPNKTVCAIPDTVSVPLICYANACEEDGGYAAGVPSTVQAIKAKKMLNGQVGRSKNIKLETGKVQRTVENSANYPQFMRPETKKGDCNEVPQVKGLHSSGKFNPEKSNSVKHNIVHPGHGESHHVNETSKNFPFNPHTRMVGEGHGILAHNFEVVLDSATGKPTHAGNVRSRQRDDDLGRPERGKNTTTVQPETGKVMTKNIPSVMSPDFMKSPFESNRSFFESPRSHVAVQALRDVGPDPSHAAGLHKHQHQIKLSKRMAFPEMDAEAHRKNLRPHTAR